MDSKLFSIPGTTLSALLIIAKIQNSQSSNLEGLHHTETETDVGGVHGNTMLLAFGRVNITCSSSKMTADRSQVYHLNVRTASSAGVCDCQIRA